MGKSRIICTLGPSSQDASTLGAMMRAGMAVARLNFSHGTHREHQSRLDLVRRLSEKHGRDVRILQDLQGYRIRIGKFKGRKWIVLKAGQIVFLTNKSELTGRDIVPFDYRGSLADIKTGSSIYVDDGNIALKVRTKTKDYIRAEVIVPGVLKENKGVNIPEVNLRFKGLTDKDRTDLEFGVRNRVDFVAQSFVSGKEDILCLRSVLRESRADCRVIAKIENRRGIDNIDEILSVSDGIMIARGDMGVSLPIFQIPVLQKMIIRKCKQRRKFAVTATQMLESMTEHLRPTRAEVSDVANAMIDGSDYLMLSAETAVGKHPVEAVEMMTEIIDFTTRSLGKLHS
ncbi:MAG: pyruvate kinase [Candidatus Eisenbacteria bacterium]|nr:pyruvate kinase [Candidatus Eisenbacteria bacterium]